MKTYKQRLRRQGGYVSIPWLRDRNATSQRQASVGDALKRTQQNKGSVLMMPAGDSTMEGGGWNQGFRAAMVVMLTAMGFTVKTCGDQAGNSGQEKLLYNSYGNTIAHHAKGGITVEQLLLGSSPELGTWDNALTTYKPDFILIAIGTNGSTVAGYAALFAKIAQRLPDVPVVLLTSYTSNAVTVSYYDFDTTQDTNAELARQAAAAAGVKCIVVNAMQALSMWTRYPNRDLTADHGNANGIFIDTAHLEMEANAMIVASAGAQMFDTSPHVILRAMCSQAPYQPLDLGYGADIAAAANATPSGQFAQRKKVLTSLTIYNTGSATATVTINRIRKSQDGSTTSTTTAALAFKVGAGLTRGKSWDFNGMGLDCQGPVAWYNESWNFAVTGDTCNIEAQFKQVVA